MFFPFFCLHVINITDRTAQQVSLSTKRTFARQGREPPKRELAWRRGPFGNQIASSWVESPVGSFPIQRYRAPLSFITLLITILTKYSKCSLPFSISIVNSYEKVTKSLLVWKIQIFFHVCSFAIFLAKSFLEGYFSYLFDKMKGLLSITSFCQCMHF